jgi:hypothetical protein
MKEIDFKPGHVYEVGGKLMGVCANCEKLIRIDKPIFGSMHVCATDEEIAAKNHRRMFGR